MPNPEQIRIISLLSFIILMVLGFRRPILCVVAYMILVYCKLSSYYPILGIIRAESLFAVIIFVGLIIKGDVKQKLFGKNKQINKYFIIFIIWVFVNYMVFAWDKAYSWDNAVYHFIKVIILYIMIIVSIDNERDFKFFFYSFLFMFMYLAYEPSYYFLNKTGGDVHMYGVNYIASIGLLSGHVALANNMNQMIPLALYIIYSKQKIIQKILISLPLIFFLIALVGSGSRGGVVGLAVFGCIFIFNSKNRLKTFVTVFLILSVVFVSSNSLTSTATRIDNESAAGRFIGLTHGIGIFLKGNIFGVGPGCYLFARKYYFSYTMESHNIYGQVIGDLGFPGVIIWFMFIKQLFKNLSESKKRLIDNYMENSSLYWIVTGMQASLIVRLVISMASHGLYYFYWYVMAAMSVSILNLTKNRENSDLEFDHVVYKNSRKKLLK